MLMEPVNRGSAWRKGFKTPVNYDDDGNYCGGLFVSVHIKHKIKNVFFIHTLFNKIKGSLKISLSYEL